MYVLIRQVDRGVKLMAASNDLPKLEHMTAEYSQNDQLARYLLVECCDENAIVRAANPLEPPPTKSDDERTYEKAYAKWHMKRVEWWKNSRQEGIKRVLERYNLPLNLFNVACLAYNVKYNIEKVEEA